jgi:dTDP-glucose pyrophosphorylase
MNIVIPIASEDEAFYRAGYTVPRPLIEVCGAPLIKWATSCLENVQQPLTHIFLVLEQHVTEYDIDDELRELYGPEAKIIVLEEMTDGPAETVLEAREYIKRDEELIVLFGDQYVESSLSDTFNETTADGVIPVFESSEPQWGYVETHNQDEIVRIVEKEPVSKNAIAGVYYFSSGDRYLNAADQMISKDLRTDGIYKLSPVYNELVEQGYTARICDVKRMVDLGTPEAVRQFQADCPEVEM